MRRLLGFSVLLFSLATTAYAQSAPSTPHGAGDYFVYAGSYTNPTPTTKSESKGIYAWRFDSKTGALTPIGLVAETVNPAHVWGHPNGAFLYAANWEDGTPGDHVSAFAIDRHTGKLTLINKVSAKGDRANQVVLDPSGKLAATVTYNSGTFSVFGVEADGKLTEADRKSVV